MKRTLTNAEITQVFLQGRHCSQCVLGQFSDLTGYDRDETDRIAACFGSLGKTLTEFDARLIKRIEAEKRSEHGGLVLVHRHKSTKSARRYCINDDGRNCIKEWALRVACHKRFRLRAGIGKQYSVVFGVAVPRHFAPYDVNARAARSFAKPLIEAVLRLVAVGAPYAEPRVSGNPKAFGRVILSKRLHFKLLQPRHCHTKPFIVRQQTV